jgi:hypothetical protein
VFCILNVSGNAMCSLIIFDKNEVNLYARAFFQFITGLMVMGV